MKNKILFCIFIVILLKFSLVFVSGSIFQDLNAGNFDNGTYNETFYNLSGFIQLNSSMLNGSYISRIFDAGNPARWNNLSILNNLPSIEYFYAADDNADIWKSSDGIGWSLVKDDYNNGNANGAKISFFNASKSYFVIYNQKVWVSDNFGVNWTKVNDDYNGAEGQNGDSGIVDKNDFIYIIEGDQDVWRSNNSGLNWTKTSVTFSTKNTAGLVVNHSNVLITVDLGSDVWMSGDNGSTWIKLNDDYNGAEGNGATAMAIDLNNFLYILDTTAVWKSNDSGATWTKQTSDFDSSDAHLGFSITTDSNNNIYIIDGNEDVYVSYNSGVNFTKLVTNFNSGNGNARAFSKILLKTNLTFQLRNCSFSNCSDGSWQTLNLDNMNLTGRYFQYRANFSAEDVSVTPKLYNVSLDYTIFDYTAPSFLNYAENPINNSAYVSGNVYRFNVTISETNPGTVWIEFNGTNYTGGDIINISNVYMFNRTSLAVGTYSYQWWANDSYGNMNSSVVRNYILDKGVNTLILTSSVGWADITYGTSANFSCSSLYGTPNLYINNSPTANPFSITLATGLHNIKCNISETQNYSSEMSQGSLTVNKANSQTSLTFDKTSPKIYGTMITPTCSVISGVGSPVLKINGNMIPSGIALNLSAGNHNFDCSLSSSQNYSYSENASSFIIDPVSTTTNLIISPLSPITYGTASNFSCLNSADLQTVLYINGIDKSDEKSIDVIRSAGNYTINCSYAGNQNYSSSSEQISYFINKTDGDIKLYLNGIEDNLLIDYPQQYNITANSLYGAITIFRDGVDITSNNSLNVTPVRNAGYYNITAVSSGDENHSSATITRWLNVTLDIIPPEINLTSPQEGGSFGYNMSLPLGLSVRDEHLDSCWYNLDNGNNITLANCQNSTFNINADGTYTLYLYANDSLGNIAVKNSTFSVLVGYPTIIVNSPIGIYLNTHNITLRYTPSDLDLGSCELWGDFTGAFELNQTNNTPVNGVENTFGLILPDGTYKWNIRCNDSMGHYAFNGNKTFYIDTEKPSLSILSPNGKQTVRNTIPFIFSVSDQSPLNCLYNVYRGINIEIQNTSIDCNASANFKVTVDADFVLNLFATDLAGNTNSVNSSFNVDTSTPSASSPGTGSGSGSSGGIGPSTKSKEFDIKITPIETIMYPGEENSFELSVKNMAAKSVNKCRIKTLEGQEKWIYTTDIKNIASGEIVEFLFKLTLPENAEPKLSLECLEGNKSIPFKVTLVKSNLNVKISSISLQDDNNILIKYNVESDSNLLVDLIFSVYAGKEKIKEQSQKIDLLKGQKKNQELVIELGDTSPGLLKISVTKQGEEKSLTEESIMYGSKITGSVISNLFTNPSVPIILIIIIFLLCAIIIIRKIIIARIK